jgi:hypothetical protein
MRGVILIALGVVAVTGSFLILGTQPSSIIHHYRETLTPMMFVLWLTGFLVATLAPPTSAIAFWYGGKRFRHRWILNALLLPTMFISVRGCVALMLFAADEPDSDSLTGWATDPAVLLMIFCTITFYVALGVQYAAKLRQSASGN